MKHWSRTELRDEIEAASHRISESRGSKVDTRLIGRWESGEVQNPQGVYRRLLAHIGAPVPSLPTQKTDEFEDDDEDMDRRRFLRNAGSAMAVAVGAPAAAFYGSQPTSVRVDAGYIRELRSTVDGLYRQDQAIGGASLAQSALQQYYDVRRLLDESDYSERVGRDLMSIAGETAVCAGWLSYDGGDQRGSRSLYAEAFLMADQSENNLLAIQSLEKMTLQASFIADRARHRGSAREAGRIGERVADLARPQPSPRLHALIASRQAIAYATAGNEREFGNSMSRAWREMERVDPANSQDGAWLAFVTTTEIRIQEAKGYRYLGNPEDAVRLYRACVSEPGLPARNRACYHAQLAASLYAMGDVVSALDEGTAILPALEGAVASARTVAELYPARKAAEALGDHDFCSRYDKLATSETIPLANGAPSHA